jgi:hypothetical protein
MRKFRLAIIAAAAAVGAAPSAWADDFSGHFHVINTSSTGVTFTEEWDVTPCGPGCASVVTSQNGTIYGTHQAHLVGNQWIIDAPSAATCPDGSTIPDAARNHVTIDANLRHGTEDVTYTDPCRGGYNVGQVYAHQLALSR